jgi:hypothetical protein
MDLFDYGRRQAILERDRGMALAAKAEDQHQPDWNDQALALICELAHRQQLIHVDDVRPRIAPPAHSNSWGSVWMRAIRAQVIEKSGERRRSSDPKLHAHDYPVYRSLIWRAG